MIRFIVGTQSLKFDNQVRNEKNMVVVIFQLPLHIGLCNDMIFFIQIFSDSPDRL